MTLKKKMSSIEQLVGMPIVPHSIICYQFKYQENKEANSETIKTQNETEKSGKMNIKCLSAISRLSRRYREEEGSQTTIDRQIVQNSNMVPFHKLTIP